MTKVTIYDASGRDRIALSAWKTMFGELREFKDLIHRLVVRNIAGQFRQSYLGYIWVALPPVATTIVFTMLRGASVFTVPMDPNALPYPLFTLIGVTIWTIFTQFTLMSTTSISTAGSLVSKIYFPREALLLGAAGSVLVTALINTLVVIVSFALFRVMPAWQVLLTPLYFLPIIFLAIGLAFFFAPINAMMHDVHRMVQFAFQFGMFLAPTIYPTPKFSELDTLWKEILFWLHTLNPVTHVINAIRDLIQGAYVVPGPGFWIAAILSVLVFGTGWRFFHICEPLLAERI